MPTRISGSERANGGIRVFFGNDQTDDAYYAHSISSVGSESDLPSEMTTMWSWINHMRGKRWWNESLEQDFICEIRKYLV